MSFIVIFTTQGRPSLESSSVDFLPFPNFMPFVADGHTAWIHCFWTSNQFQRLYWWFPKAYLITVAAQLNVTCWRHHFLTRLVKPLAKLDVKKQQSSNFMEMTLGRYISIQSFCGIFTVPQTTSMSIFEHFMTKFLKVPEQPSYTSSYVTSYVYARYLWRKHVRIVHG